MVRHLNFDSIKKFVSQCTWGIVFAKPVGSKLYRVFQLPDLDLPEDDKNEIIQTLNTICSRYHNGVWYFKLDEEDEQITANTFSEMGIVAYIMSPSKEILN